MEKQRIGFQIRQQTAVKVLRISRARSKIELRLIKLNFNKS